MPDFDAAMRGRDEDRRYGWEEPDTFEKAYRREMARGADEVHSGTHRSDESEEEREAA